MLLCTMVQVKRMSTDIPFIVDTLHTSSMLEVQVRSYVYIIWDQNTSIIRDFDELFAVIYQGDKVRRREEWSKWIPASVVDKSSLKDENSLKQSEEIADTDSIKKDTSGEDHSSTKTQSKYSRQNLDKVCDDFSSTFMFDEELELEHKKDDNSSKPR